LQSDNNNAAPRLAALFGRRETMKAQVGALMMGLVLASNFAYAQEPKVFVEGVGSATFSTNASAGSFGGQIGVRIAKDLFVIADLGRLDNVSPSTLQSRVGQAIQLASYTDIGVTSSSHVPVWYGMGGLRFQSSAPGRFRPFASASFGLARLTPAAAFTFTGGTGQGLLASAPAVGSDVTSQVVALGLFVQPTPETHPMLGLEGGVSVGLGPRLSLDLGYRYARIFSADPLNLSGLMFGVGYHF
jgi:hypothetical protein